MSVTQLEIATGAVIGSYRLLKLIGRGGMGEVWLAEHAMLGRRAAVKLLHDHYSRQQDVVTRFFNEARAATAITDPGIVQVFDFGQHTDGNVYIVMELLAGEPLDERLARRGSLGLAESLRLVRQVASSLGAAHAAGVVHRDLKPENIFVVRDPEVAGGERTKILDFGIAKLAAFADTGVKTNTALLMGTPTYMSPEQCRGAGHVDLRSDIYSLGCVLYQLLVGRVPFEHDAVGELIAMHLREPPPAPSVAMHGLPASVDALVLRCLAKDPADRYAHGGDLAAALDALLAEPEVAATSMVAMPRLSAGGRGPSPTTMSSTASERISVPGLRRSRVPAIAALALACAGIAIATGIHLRRGSDEAPVAAAANVPAAPPADPAAAPPPPPPHEEPTIVVEHVASHARAVVDVPAYVPPAAPPPVPRGKPAPTPEPTTEPKPTEIPCDPTKEWCK